MRIATIYRIEDGLLSGTEIQLVIGFVSVKYPHRKTPDLYVPPMEANGKKVETFHCCQKNCKQPDFKGTLEALAEHLMVHKGRLIKKLPPITKAHPAAIAVELPPNPWRENDTRGTNPDRRFVVSLYINSVIFALKKQGIGILKGE